MQYTEGTMSKLLSALVSPVGKLPIRGDFKYWTMFSKVYYMISIFVLYICRVFNKFEHRGLNKD